LAQQVAGYYASEMKTTITIDKVDIRFFDSVLLEGVYIEDQKGDTLIYAPKLTTDIGELSLGKSFIDIDQIALDNARINLKVYEGEQDLNLQFLVDYFASEDTTESEWKFTVDQIAVSNAHFSYVDENAPPLEGSGMNFSNMDFRNFDIAFEDFKIEEDSIYINLDHLAVQDVVSGFDLDTLKADIKISPLGIEMVDLLIRTPDSRLVTDNLTFKTKRYEDLSDFLNKVKLNTKLGHSYLKLDDLAYFVPGLKDAERVIELKGQVKGTISNLKTKKLDIKLSEETWVKANIDMSGLPEIENTFFSVNIDEFVTNKADIGTFELPEIDLNVQTFLDTFNAIAIPNEVHLQATFMGYLTDFVAYGELKTDFGKVEADIHFADDPQENHFTYGGKIETKGFNLANLYNVGILGPVDADLNVNGYGFNWEELHTTIAGDIHQMTFNDYSYHKGRIDAVIEKDIFSGLLTVKDKNIDLVYDGDINFSSAIPSFDFTATINEAKLDPLNFLDRYEESTLCTTLDIDAKGNSPDNFEGTVKVLNTSYYENGKEVSIDTILVFTNETAKGKILKINSPMVDAHIEGIFNFNDLPNSATELAKAYAPALFAEENTYRKRKTKDQSFDYDITIKDLTPITELLIPELYISPNSFINGYYRSADKDFNLHVNSNKISFGAGGAAQWIDDLDVVGKRENDTMSLITTVDNVHVNDNLSFESLNLTNKVSNSKLVSEVAWNSDDGKRSHIGGVGEVINENRYEFDFNPSSLHFKGETWVVEDSALLGYDKGLIYIDNMTVSNLGQAIDLYGKVSENKEDRLNLSLSNFDLDVLNAFLGDTSITYQGLVNGDGFVADLYHNIFFASDFRVEKLGVNNSVIGDIVLESKWDSLRSSVYITGNLARDGVPSVEFKGNYDVEKEKDYLDFRMDLKETDIAFLNELLPEGVSDFSGYLNGYVKLKGDFADPNVRGRIDFESTTFKVDLLNTYYTFNGRVNVYKDMITIDNQPMTDVFGNQALIIATLLHENYANWNFDIVANIDEKRYDSYYKKWVDNHFLAMDLEEDMNPYYFGEAYATGVVEVEGYNDLINIDVKAKSEKGTQITLPLYGSEEVVAQDFVTFINPNDTVQDDDRHNVDLEGITMKFDFEVTPDAEIKIVFDDVVGDAMGGTAKGNILMEIDQFFEFKMYGMVEVVRGDYLFTLSNVINKHFYVEPGGTISWFGDPYNAQLDLNTIYSLDAPLYDLMTDNAERYKSNTLVNVNMGLAGGLFNPEIKFGIDLPKVDENTRGVVASLLNSEAELNKQVFALMVIKKFLPPSNAVSNASDNVGLGVGKATTSELLSNQLSNWLSQISDKYDIGINYRPGDPISNEELEVAFKTQIFNDRLSISGNFGVSNGNDANQNPSSLIGDVNVEYLINEEGTFRVRGFNESNDFDVTNTSQAPYTQGVGVYYQEEFDRSADSRLLQRFLNIFRKKSNRKKPWEDKRETDDVAND
jgi:hypothetical protein